MKNSLSVFRRIAQLAVCGFTIALPALATDTHGNLPPDGTIGLLDFGMYVELTERERNVFILYFPAIVQH